MNILIIKPDHIGDYIVFRNFIQDIKKLKDFENCNITCVLNQRVKDLALYLDNDIIDKFIFIELEKYIIGDWHFKRRNQEINTTKYDIVINAMFAHFQKVEELIQEINCTRKCLLYESIYDPKENYIKTYGSKYSQIIDVSKKEFEFEKFKYSFKKIFKEGMATKKPNISLPNNYLDLNFNFNYIVVFIGSDAEYRKWNIYKYAKVIEYIINSTNLHVILCGSIAEKKESIEIDQLVNSNKLHNLVTQTTLLDMCHIVERSEFIISNETGIAHLSMALNKYTLVVSNGNHFGKFTPYPKQYTNRYYGVYPFTIETEEEFRKNKELYYNKSRLDINKIKVEDVIIKLRTILKELNINNSNYILPPLNYKINSLSPSQIDLNYSFSYTFSKVYEFIQNLKNSNKTFLIYGDGTFGKIVSNILKESCVGIIDKQNIESFQKLKSDNYDKIIISVLGREDIIEKDLVNNYNININTIIKFKITEGKYNVRTK